MKKIIALLLVLSMAASFAGCGAEPAAPAEPETTEAPVVEATEAETVPAVVVETQSLGEENLYLTVSSITFSVVGESEDIYLGLAPRDQVVWESENPEIISVENGVLTAVGVGSTTIHATYGGRQVSCKAGCLAQTREEMDALDMEILSAPKRILPELDLSEVCTHFNNSAILGDSITYNLWQEESKTNYLGDVTIISRHGISVHSLVLHSKNLYFEGKDMAIEDIVAKVSANRIFLMLGCLDYQVDSSRAMLVDNWKIMLERIEEKAPDKEIVIISNIPRSEIGIKPTPFNLAVVDTTAQLRQIAADKGYVFIDLGCYIEDHYGRMPDVYRQDEFHMNPDGSLVWMKLMRLFAQIEREGGSWK